MTCVRKCIIITSGSGIITIYVLFCSWRMFAWLNSFPTLRYNSPKPHWCHSPCLHWHPIRVSNNTLIPVPKGTALYFHIWVWTLLLSSCGAVFAVLCRMLRFWAGAHSSACMGFLLRRVHTYVHACVKWHGRCETPWHCTCMQLLYLHAEYACTYVRTYPASPLKHSVGVNFVP